MSRGSLSRLIGISVMAAFAAAWLTLGLRLAQVKLAWSTPAAWSVAALLIVAAFWRSRRLDGGPPRRIDRRLAAVGIGGEIALLVLAAYLLPVLHRPDLLMPVVAVIVGLHFLPLARAFDVPTYLPTGLALTAVGVAGVILQGAARPLEVGIGAAVVLWLTCATLVAGDGRFG